MPKIKYLGLDEFKSAYIDTRDLPGKCPGHFFGILDFLPIGNTLMLSKLRIEEVANFIVHLLHKEGAVQNET